MNSKVKALVRMNIRAYGYLFIIYGILNLILSAVLALVFSLQRDTEHLFGGTTFIYAVWLVLNPVMCGVTNVILRGIRSLRITPVTDKNLTDALFLIYILGLSLSCVPLAAGVTISSIINPQIAATAFSLLFSVIAAILFFFSVYTVVSVKYMKKKLPALWYYVIIIISLIGCTAGTLATFNINMLSGFYQIVAVCGLAVLSVIGFAVFWASYVYMKKNVKSLEVSSEPRSIFGGYNT